MGMEKSVSRKEALALLRLARAAIAAKFKGKNEDTKILSVDIPEVFLTQKKGVFVTLHKKGHLRGCIGNIEPKQTLVNGIKDNAISAAFKDSRFSPLTPDELTLIDIEISILSTPEKMAYQDTRDLLSHLRPGVDGVIIEKDYRRATFLPQVWEQLPEAEDFLDHLCVKAGLSASEWKKGGLTLHTYQVQSFGEMDENCHS